MADDAAPRPRPRLSEADLADLSAAVAEAEYADEQAPLDHAMTLRRARGELIPVEQVFDEFRRRTAMLMADGSLSR